MQLKRNVNCLTCKHLPTSIKLLSQLLLERLMFLTKSAKIVWPALPLVYFKTLAIILSFTKIKLRWSNALKLKSTLLRVLSSVNHSVCALCALSTWLRTFALTIASAFALIENSSYILCPQAQGYSSTFITNFKTVLLYLGKFKGHVVFGTLKCPTMISSLLLCNNLVVKMYHMYICVFYITCQRLY